MALNFANTKGFKAFMAKLYGWGASLVILGALFKINHYEGASLMLILGMGTEAIIFFFSAFEKPHVEVDWSAVYPELAPQYGGGGHVSGAPKAARQEQTNKPIDDLNQLFKQAGVNVNLIQDFGDGLRKFGDTARQMVNVSSAAAANSELVGNMTKASENLVKLNAAYETQIKNVSEIAPINTQKLQTAMDELSGNLHSSITELSNKLNTSVGDLSGQVQSSAEQINNYQKQMQMLTTNISALNNVYGNMLSAMTGMKS